MKQRLCTFWSTTLSHLWTLNCDESLEKWLLLSYRMNIFVRWKQFSFSLVSSRMTIKFHKKISTPSMFGEGINVRKRRPAWTLNITIVSFQTLPSQFSSWRTQYRKSIGKLNRVVQKPIFFHFRQKKGTGPMELSKTSSRKSILLASLRTLFALGPRISVVCSGAWAMRK